jgi:hypothetical protein
VLEETACETLLAQGIDAEHVRNMLGYVDESSRMLVIDCLELIAVVIDDLIGYLEEIAVREASAENAAAISDMPLPSSRLRARTLLQRVALRLEPVLRDPTAKEEDAMSPGDLESAYWAIQHALSLIMAELTSLDPSIAGDPVRTLLEAIPSDHVNRILGALGLLEGAVAFVLLILLDDKH